MSEALPGSAKQQRQMQRNADQAILDRCRHFADLQAGPNPLSQDEIDELAARHPERWSLFARQAR